MPVRYLITFSCYGTHLHGDKGMVDRRRNVYGSRFLEPNIIRVKAEQELMSEGPYSLDQDRRHLVLKALREVSSFRGWTLLAAHVRTNHVHCVVLASNKPEKIMNDFKAHASRLLNES